MTRRKLFGGVALSGFTLSSAGTASPSLATAPAAGLTRLSLNENPFGPSPLAVRAIQNALIETHNGANVVVFRTFVRIYGLAGRPMGYAIAPKGVADSLKRVGLGTARSQNRLAVTAAAASLRDTSYVDRMRLKVIEEREKWHALLDAIGRAARILGGISYFSRRDNRTE